MRELVVLPLVPVMATVLTPAETMDSSSGHSFRAMRPGMAVPPRCSSRDRSRSSLQRMMAKMAFSFIKYSPMAQRSLIEQAMPPLSRISTSAQVSFRPRPAVPGLITFTPPASS